MGLVRVSVSRPDGRRPVSPLFLYTSCRTGLCSVDVAGLDLSMCVTYGREMRLLILSFAISGCCTTGAKTLAEQQSGYTYYPLDPMPIALPAGCDPAKINVLASLPDNAVRVLVEETDAKADVAFGPARTTAEGNSYKLTVDYINSNTISVPLWIKKTALEYKGSTVPKDVDLYRDVNGDLQIGSASYSVSRTPAEGHQRVEMPLYVGLGLRIVANVVALSGKVSIAGLGGLAADADAKKLSGSLIVQTLGVNGRAISAAMPISSELDRTTVQGAVVAISSIKTRLHEADTIVSPRIVGLYLPFPADKKLVNAIIGALASKDIDWRVSCPTTSAPDGPTFVP